MQKKINDVIQPIVLSDIYDNSVNVPQTQKLTHLQFRRFAGCPICNLHINSFFQRADELATKNIQSVIIFHSTQQRMRDYVVDINTVVPVDFQQNFSLIADPKKHLYTDFGLENTWMSLMHPQVIFSALKGLTLKSFASPEKLETELVVPADFLIDETGRIIACKYGKHADDQWSVDDVLSLI